MAKVLAVRIETGEKSFQYKNRINAEDYKLLALLLQDLESYDIPVRKAIKEFLNAKQEFPW